MTEAEIAGVIIDRLNVIIQDPNVREDVERLVETRIKATSQETLDHPSIQSIDGEVGFLGLLNGILGTIPEGKFKGWGYVMAVFDDDGKLMRFQDTRVAKLKET